MKIGRFKVGDKIIWGTIKDNKILEIESPFENQEIIGEIGFLEETKILSPVLPSKIVAVGLNYRDHAEELGMKIPEEPLLFLKPPSAVIGHNEFIILPKESKEIHYEGEMAVVIRKKIYRPKSFKEIKEAILGYTCFNDVTARDLQKKDGQWTRSKSFDTFAPIGPFIETEVDPNNLIIETRVNGKIVQKSNTNQLIFNVFELIKFISNIMTLLPGDVIATGTPPGVGPLKEGDIVEVYIEKIGNLRNFCKTL